MPVDTARALRLSRLALVGQLALVGLAVAVAQFANAPRVRLWLVLAITGCNALLVGTVSMGVARERTLVQRLLVIVLLMVASLLFWPAWGEYDGARFH